MTATVAALALHYALRGLAVLALHTPTAEGCTCRAGADCPSPGKHPRTRNGLHDATCDPRQIEAWWERWPTANVGVRVPTSRVILDVDPRAGGDDTLARLLLDHGPLPDTLTAHTGGGWHLWLRHDGPAVGRLGPGLDVKAATTGYVVAPPSLHHSGQHYRWANHLPVADAPPWLTGRLSPRRVARRRAHAMAG